MIIRADIQLLRTTGQGETEENEAEVIPETEWLHFDHWRQKVYAMVPQSSRPYNNCRDFNPEFHPSVPSTGATYYCANSTKNFLSGSDAGAHIIGE